MANALEAIFNEDQEQKPKDTSVSFDISDFQKETSEIAKDKAKINPTYEEIFNITKSMNPVMSNFNTVDNQTQEYFRQKSEQISKEYSSKIMDITSNPNLTDSEKRFEVQSSMNQMVMDITDEAHPILEKSANKEKIKSEVKDLEITDSAGTFATKESLEGAEERLDTEVEIAKKSYTFENAKETLDTVYNNAITDLSHIAVTETIGAIVNSDAIAYAVNPMLLAKDITESIADNALGVVEALREAVINTPLDAADRFTDYGKNLVKSFIQTPTDIAKNAIEKSKAWMNDKVDQIINMDKTDVTGTELNYVKIERIKRSDFKIVHADSNKAHMVTDSLYMSLDNFWDVDIVVPAENKLKGLPSFRECYGLDEMDSYHLPVTSFNYIGEGVQNIDQEMYPGLVVPLPMVYMKPSKFSIQIPDLVHRTKNLAESCMLSFKTKYINYVMGNDKTSYIFKDFRTCAYILIIKKYSLRWELLNTWCFYAIPEVNISEMGSSSPTVEFSELSFSIIGQAYNPKPYSGISVQEFISDVKNVTNNYKNMATNII